MTKETGKLIMIRQLQVDRKRLAQYLASLPQEDWLAPRVIGAWSIKDVLAHLAHWEARMPVWLADARAGRATSGPEFDLGWKQMHEFNQRIYEAHRDQSLGEVLEYFHASHDAFMEMVLDMPEEEMMEKGRYPLTGKLALYNWLSQYAAHDRWAKNHIRAWKLKRGKGAPG